MISTVLVVKEMHAYFQVHEKLKDVGEDDEDTEE